MDLNANQLAEVLRTVIAESKKPADPTPEELAQKAADREHRKQMAQLQQRREDERSREQEACVHCRLDGTTTGVYVQNGNYIICQQCQKIIRPETELQLFNRLMQLGASGGGKTNF
jgi:hypothetical protein